MSNLVGWVVLFKGSPGGAGTGARLYSSAAFPARAQIEAAAANHQINHVRFSPNNGGWVIICNDGSVVYSEQGGSQYPQFPQDAEQIIAGGPASSTFRDIFFTPTGDWICTATTSRSTTVDTRSRSRTLFGC